MANRSIPENVLLEHSSLAHYALIPVEMVNSHLETGCLLWGNPVYNLDKKIMYQAVIKIDMPKSLTPKEQKIYSLLQEGMSPKAIAGEIHVSIKTVYKYHQRIREKIAKEKGHLGGELG